ncbi:MAG TPA: preprotein translocase subunit SecG, partial [Candidatus Sumerlaeota bacterium]|nr:preprotein translocase subunit SecG [Candidatus Sumerlaeota bacterium]
MNILMSVLFWVLFIAYIFSAAVLVLVVLVQSGKGGGLSGLVSAGSTLGDTLGATGAEKTLNRWTTYCAVGFIVFNI